MKAALIWLFATFIALLLAAAGPALDGLPADQDAADATTLGHDIDMAQRRMERVAVVLCRLEAGPNATASWTPDGQVVCAPGASHAQLGDAP